MSLNGLVEDGIGKIQSIISKEFNISLDTEYLHKNTDQNNSSVNILLNEEVQSLESSAANEGVHSSVVNSQSFIKDNSEENIDSISSGEMNNLWIRPWDHSEMGGKENEIVSEAYHYTQNSAGEINRGNINYVFAMENGDFIEIWYNITHDIFWNAARISDYDIFFEGWEKVASEGIIEKENTYDFVFKKVFDYSTEVPGEF